MKILNDKEVRSFESFCQMKQKELIKAMTAYLKTKYKKIISTSEYVIAVGDMPVGIVAHLDTVFTTPPKNIYYDRRKSVMWSPEGLGADDRAGVYAAIQLVRQGYRPTIIFTTDEESGALGASSLIRDYPEPPAAFNYLIQLDRRGAADCVFYDCNNLAFEEYVEAFGFVTAWGSFSDISVLCPAWKVAGVNLSIGYDDEHSYSETLHVGRMLNTIQKVKTMLEDIDNTSVFKYIPTEKQQKVFHCAYNYTNEDWSYSPAYGVSETTWDEWLKDKETDMVSICNFCEITDYVYNFMPVVNSNGDIDCLCIDCFQKFEEANLINYCNICGSAYLNVDKDQTICQKCEKELRVNE